MHIKYIKRAIVALAVVILSFSSFPTIVLATPPDNPVSDLLSQQILVKFRSGTTPPEAADIHRIDAVRLDAAGRL